jgi:diguanylate cyclase (GGDEF)-like protein
MEVSMAVTGDTDLLKHTELLRNTDLFKGLSEKDLGYVISRMSPIPLQKGERLFSSGQRADRCYILQSGSVRVFKRQEDGVVDDLAVFTPPDVLGDFDFARRALYDACAEAREASVVWAFPGLGFDMDTLAQEAPEPIAHVNLRSLVMISGRLRATQRLISENAPWVQELRRRSFEDPGTGLWNRSFLEEELSKNPEAPFSLILFKPDRFKILVDSRGHAAGDEGMVKIAAILKETVRRRGTGWALRLKSNEVALALPTCTAEEAQTIAQGVRGAIEALEPVPATGDLPPFSFTASACFGVWPEDAGPWAEFFPALYALLLETWRNSDPRLARLGQGPSV